jgi:hypothetical protein
MNYQNLKTAECVDKKAVIHSSWLVVQVMTVWDWKSK